MTKKIFITGTDTEVGKTYNTLGLLDAFNRQGYKTIGLKPVGSGGVKIDGQIVNEDAKLINQKSSITLPYHYTNPFSFEEPIAPHIAAQHESISLTLTSLLKKTEEPFSIACDIYLVEGVGGWFVPLNLEETMADFVIHHRMEVILVVGIKLGCINHALLTQQAILASRLKLAGWIANCIEPKTLMINENIHTLKSKIAAPFLGRVDFGVDPSICLDTSKLF